jgi:predicted transcriptional regulator
MTPTLKSILHEAATSLLETRDRVETRDVVLKARMLHADIFEREQERLLMEAAGRVAKAIMKELSENDQPTLSLSGLAVATAIAVPME